MSNAKCLSTFDGKHIVLRTVDMYALKHLFSWYQNLEYELSHLVHDCQMVYNELTFKEEFLSLLKNSYHVFLFIYPKNAESNADPIGFISTYKFNRLDGHIQLSIFLLPEYRKMHYSVEAGIIICHYLFTYYPIRKVCCSVFGYNTVCADLLLSIGFEKDGELRQHKYYNGRYYNVFLFSLFRDDFYNRSNKFLSRMNKTKV